VISFEVWVEATTAAEPKDIETKKRGDRRDSRCETLSGMIKVAGIDVPRAAIAELALKLHQAGESGLASHVGHAIDHNHDELVIANQDRGRIYRLLTDDPIPGLEALRDKLRH
jgi:hypothetical protein